MRFGWLGVCAGAGTPRPIISLLNRHIAVIVQSTDHRGMSDKAGTIALSSTPEELGKILEETYEQTARVSREFGLQL